MIHAKDREATNEGHKVVKLLIQTIIVDRRRKEKKRE